MSLSNEYVIKTSSPYRQLGLIQVYCYLIKKLPVLINGVRIYVVGLFKPNKSKYGGQCESRQICLGISSKENNCQRLQTKSFNINELNLYLWHYSLPSLETAMSFLA